MTVPIASAIEALLAPGARHRNDVSTYRDLDVKRRGDRLPRGLTLEWLGTASFRLDYEGFTLLVDPNVSRPSVAHTFSRGPLLPDPGRVARYFPKADAVLVGHTHFDHAMDVPEIARTHGCPVYGSTSCVRLLGLHGLARHGVAVTTGRVYEIGPFEVTFIESVHSKLVLGLKVNHGGELTCDHLDDLRGSTYRCGQVYGIHIAAPGATFYHQGSADLLDDRIVHRGVDYFLCGIAGRGYTPRYVSRVLTRLSPRVVVPHHFDDFFRPLDATMGFSLNVNLGGFVEEVRATSGDFTVRTLPLLAPWGALSDA